METIEQHDTLFWEDVSIPWPALMMAAVKGLNWRITTVWRDLPEREMLTQALAQIDEVKAHASKEDDHLGTWGMIEAAMQARIAELDELASDGGAYDPNRWQIQLYPVE